MLQSRATSGKHNKLIFDSDKKAVFQIRVGRKKHPTSKAIYF